MDGEGKRGKERGGEGSVVECKNPKISLVRTA